MPAAAQTQGAALSKAHSQRSAPTPTAAQRKALERAKHLMALRNQRGSIVGLVNGPNGAPEGNVCVVASSPLATHKAYTKPDGRFLIEGLPKGAYREQIKRGGSVSGVTSVHLQGGNTRPAPGTCVGILPLSRTASATQTFATGGGSYLATNLAAGKYEILAGDPSCSSNSPTLSARLSGPVQVASGKTTAGANVRLRVTGTIAGVVRGPGGKPLAGICVEAVPQQGGIGVPTAITGAVGGGYSIAGRQPGTYKVKFTAGCGANGFATRWYKNVRTEVGGRSSTSPPPRSPAASTKPCRGGN